MTTPPEQAPKRMRAPVEQRLRRLTERYPEALERASFATAIQNEGEPSAQLFLSQDIPTQPWPTFVDGQRLAELEQVTLTMASLIRDVPERFFDNDPQRLCQFYGLEPEGADDLRRILDLPWGHGGELMRCDFIFSNGTPMCIEVNASATAPAGLFVLEVVEACLAAPVLRRFLADQSAQVRFRDPWRTLLRLAIERATSRSLHRHGTLSLGIAVSDPAAHRPALSFIAPQYKALLADIAPGTRGEVSFCGYSQMSFDGTTLSVDQQPIHILLQHYGDFMTYPLSAAVEAWMAGAIDLYTGPLGWIYRDKRNLALLSEPASSDAFDADEAAWITRHIPWSRLVKPGKVRFYGELIELERLLLLKRDDLVLKPAQSYGGHGVTVGRFAPPDVWEETARDALADGTYLVQEYLPGDLELKQWGESGCEPCELNWGLFAAGGRFGGAYLRVCPPPADGVVNIGNGAEGACVLELLPAHPVIEPRAGERMWPSPLGWRPTIDRI